MQIIHMYVTVSQKMLYIYPMAILIYDLKITIVQINTYNPSSSVQRDENPGNSPIRGGRSVLCQNPRGLKPVFNPYQVYTLMSSDNSWYGTFGVR